MNKKYIWFTIAIVSLAIAIASAVYIANLGTVADAQGSVGSLPFGIVAIAIIAFIASFVSFVRGAQLLAEQKR